MILLAFYGVQIALLAAQAPLVAIVLAAVCAGGAVTVSNTLRETALQRHVPPDMMSRISSYDWLAYAFAPLGYLLAGGAASLVGLAQVLWFGAAWILVASIVFATRGDIVNLVDDGGRAFDPSPVEGARKDTPRDRQR